MARLELPVNTISRTLAAEPALFTATGSEGAYFDNSSGDVFLEVISSTTGQQFTIQTGALIDLEWEIVDDIVNVSNPDTMYLLGKFPQNIYNQSDGSNQVWIDYDVSAVLDFRAWRLT